MAKRPPPAKAESALKSETGSHVPAENAGVVVGQSTLASAAARDRARSIEQAFDPQTGDWQSEVLSAALLKQLNRLAELIAQPKLLGDAELASLCHADFRGSPLRPEATRQQVGELFRVMRTQGASEMTLRGPDGLMRAATDLRKGFASDAQIHTKCKLVSVEPSPQQAQTTVYFEAFGPSRSGYLSQSASWNVVWELGDPQTAPAIHSVSVTAHTEVELLSDVKPLFRDQTKRTIGNSVAFHEQLAHGIDHWRDRIAEYLGIYYFGHHGLAVGDVNGDGWEDVYICQPAGLPNRLFLHQPDGTAIEQSAEYGVDVLNNCRAALFVDLDNDGDSDLVVVATKRLLIFENRDNATFALAANVDGVRGGYSVSAADFDNDADLDLYLCVYLSQNAREGRLPFPVPYHDANNGGANHLLRNEGNLKFVDVTRDVGLDQDNHRFSYAAAWEDYDNDGDPDLYVANDFGRNNLYRNTDGRFENAADDIGLEDTAFGMSLTWGDYNRDGNYDLYVGNMFSSAGSRITRQDQFQPHGDASTRSSLRRAARGNSLFQNLGNGKFRDVSVQSGASMGRWSWGTLHVDVNNDGWEDLLAVNGMFTGQSKDDL